MKNENGLKIQGVFLLVFLVIQYLLGMFVNMFVEFPNSKNQGKLWEFAWTQLPLAAHIVIGFLLIIGAIVLIIKSILNRNRSWIIASIIGYLGIQIAAVAGSLFIPSQMDVYSYVMAVAFIVAFLSYGAGLYLSKSNEKKIA